MSDNPPAGQISGSEAAEVTPDDVYSLICRIQKAHAAAAPGLARYTLFPIQDDEAYLFFKTQELASWGSEELNFVADREDYDRAPAAQKHLIDTIIAFFLPSDGLISENIIFRFLLEAGKYEEQMMFMSQLRIEAVHSETYNIAALTFLRTNEKLREYIARAEATPCIMRKAAFMEKWMGADRSRAERLLAFACAEGIFFCSLFAVIFWFRTKGTFHNFITANQMILRDEALHRDFGCYLHRQEVAAAAAAGRPSPCTAERALEIVAEAVAVEDEFIDHLLPAPVEDLTAADMKTYVRFIADLLLGQIRVDPAFCVGSNPLDFMNAIAVEGKTNFYEQRNTSYQRADLAAAVDWRKRAGLDAPGVDAYANSESVEF